jgi:hypothetical protein
LILDNSVLFSTIPTTCSSKKPNSDSMTPHRAGKIYLRIIVIGKFPEFSLFDKLVTNILKK